MDGDFRIDLDDLRKNIDTAEVISIYLPVLRRTILIDTRFTEDEPPMIRLVPMASSLDERLRELRRLRPRLPRPKGVAIVPWPKYAQSLVDLGIWQRVLERFVHSGHKEAIQACDRTLKEVFRLEREELAAAIEGENYHTLWERYR